MENGVHNFKSVANFFDANFIHAIHSPDHRRKPAAGRLVNKDGSYAIEHADHPHRLWKYWRNVFQILLEMQWRWVWLLLFIMFPLSWAAFAIAFYAIALYHGDWQDRNDNNTFIPCVQSAQGYLGMFMYSVETQETIGYGYRYDTEQCPLLIFFVCLQTVVGAVLQACLCAVIWARMLRPKRRGQEVIFSEHACVAMNSQHELCLMFRMSDMDGTHLVQSCVRLYVAVKTRLPMTTNHFSFKLYHMHMGEENGRDKVLYLWPTVVSHIINKKSPLYGYSKADLEKSDLEFIAVTEGIVESTGLTVQTRTSYLSSEVKWGYKFQKMNFCETAKKSKVKVQYKDFDTTYPVDTPVLSCKELDEIKERQLPNAVSFKL